MSTIWTANYSYPDIPLDENFDHSEIGMAIRGNGHSHLAVDIFKLKFNPNLTYKGDIIQSPDMVFLRAMLIRDDVYRNFKNLETSGTVFLNDIDAQYHASNKITIFKKLEKDKLPLPKMIYINIPFDDNIIEKIGDEIGWPCVIKWMHGYARLGVDLCESPEDLYRIIKNRKAIANEHKISEFKFDCLIVQELIKVKHVVQIHGVGDIFHAVMQFKHGNYGFKSNLLKNAITLPHKIDDELRDISSRILKSLRLDTARIEVLLTPDGYKVCEVNPQGSHGWTTMTHLKNISDILVSHLCKKYDRIKSTNGGL